MTMRSTALACSALFALSACQSAPEATLVNPATINLTDAIAQIRESLLANEADATKAGRHVGLDVCTATIALTLTVQGTSDNKGGGTIAVAAPVVPVSLGANLATEQTLVENRGNVITLQLVTPACNPAGTLGTVHPEKVVQLARGNQQVRQGRYTPFSETGGHVGAVLRGAGVTR